MTFRRIFQKTVNYMYKIQGPYFHNIILIKKYINIAYIYMFFSLKALHVLTLCGPEFCTFCSGIQCSSTAFLL